ncbi:MAG: hypothetical protein JW999_11205 [Methanotrichaceae archaeon]|nr:hypothetical protein [Methanotrichaceae archaeon]
MRILIAMVAFMTIIGMAGAWEETNYLSYQFNKVIDTQAGEHLDWLGDVYSSADFYDYNGPYGYTSAYVNNYAQSVTATPLTYEGQTVDTLDVLTQYGSAVVGAKSPDLQTPADVMRFGTATAGQNMALSGLYSDAQFSGSNYACIYGYDSNWNSYFDAWTYNSDPTIKISAVDDDRFVEADMGSQATVGFEQLMAPGAYMTLSGGFKAWGEFSGAYDPTDDWGYNSVDIDVDLSGAGTQRFYLDTW